MRLLSRLAAGLILLLPFSGHAQDVTAESAQSIQDQAHAWIAGLVGASLDPALLTPTVTAAGGHYALSLPIPGLVGDDTASATLLPLDNGRWSLQAIRVPPDMHFNLRLPEPGGPSGRVSVAVSVTIGSQDTHAVLDPSLNSRSELSVDLHDITQRSDGPKQHSRQHTGEYRLIASLQPDPAGGLDLDQAATITDWTSSTQVPGKPATTMSADRVSGKGRITGLDPDQARKLLVAAFGLIAMLPAEGAAKGGAGLSPADRAALRRLVESLRGIFTGLHGEEDIDGLHVSLAGRGEGSVRRLHLAVGGNAPNGLMHGWIEVMLDGLSIPSLPPQFAGLVPHHIVLRPSLAGLPADAVMKLAVDATQPDANQAELPAEATALVQPGSTLALEKLSFDVGPAQLQGTAHVTVTGPDEYTGEANLSATGLDALIERVRQDPRLQQAMPMLIILRGYAQPKGDRLVWHVVARDGGVTVNGMPVLAPHSAESVHPGSPHDNQK